MWAIFCPFTSHPPKKPKYQNFEKIKKLLEISCDVCFLRHGVHILGHFLPFYLHYWLQKSKLGKTVKKTGDIILLHICTINKDHMIYGSWDIKAQWTEFLVILGYFLPIDPLNLKNQNFEKMKKSLQILSFYTCVQQTTIMWCMVLEKWSTEGKIFCHFRLVFALLPPTNPENQNLKKWENT